MTDLDCRWTQSAFGTFVGVSQQAVSDLVQRGVLRADATAREWLMAYLEHLRQVAAGRAPDGELSTERARVARATAEKLERQNAVARGEYAPLGVLELVLSHLARQIATRLDALVPQIKRRHPEVHARVLQQIAAEIQVCRELCAGINLQDAERLAREGEDEDDEPPVAGGDGA